MSNNGGGLEATPLSVQRKRTFRIFNVLSSTSLGIVLFLAVGVIVYSEYTERTLNTAKQALSAVSSSDNRENVAALGVFDARLSHAKQLLSIHMEPSEIFKRIEEITRSTVQLSGFTYRYDPGFEVYLTLNGVTDTFGTVALQEMTLADSPLFVEYDLKNITYVSGRNDDGESTGNPQVSFAVQGIVDKNLIAYGRYLVKDAKVIDLPVTEDVAEEVPFDASPDVSELPNL